MPSSNRGACFLAMALYATAAWLASARGGLAVEPPTSAWLATVQAEMRESEYRASLQPSPFAAGQRDWQAPNRAHGWRIWFLADGIRVVERTNTVSRFDWQMQLRRYGYVGSSRPVTDADLRAEGARVEYRRGALTEWYVNSEAGLEQGFALQSAPEGDGDEVELALALPGDVKATVLADGDAVELGPAGAPPVISFGAMRVADACGRELRAVFAGGGDELLIRVATAGATFPITVDPLATSAAWMGEGNRASVLYSGSVASAGDVNGDGYGDLIVGAERYDNGEAEEGRAYVYLGSPSGPGVNEAWMAEINQASAQFGNSVASAGDVNGDGYADVIVGAHYYRNGENGEGAAFVYLGSPAGLSTTAAWMVEGNQVGALLGERVAGVGDVNGDGYADVIVGAYSYDNGEANEGRAYVFHGSPSGLSATPAWVAEGNQADANFGISVAGAGDVNGDGYADAIVGAYRYDNDISNQGRVYVYQGSATGLGATPAWIADGDQTDAAFGYSVSEAGDVNGDGYGDVIVGAYSYDHGQTDEGRVFVYQGSAAGLATSPAWSAEANQISAEFGFSVADAGDVDGDGYADVIVGARYYDAGQIDEGRAYVYRGSASGLSATATWTAEANQASAWFGWCVAGAGDVNGDGYADVVVGSYRYSNGSSAEGRAYVYLGSALGLGAAAGWSAESDQAGAQFGYSVASAGDVNGDGYADVIVGAWCYDNGQTDEGRAYLYPGTASGLSPTAAWTKEGDQANAYFGRSVAGAGDVNGDGFDDVIVGAQGYDHGEQDEGRAYVYAGSAAGLGSTPVWSAEADQQNANLGAGVAAAGDVNGDGYGDVIVGAPGYENGETGEGRAYVFQGSATGLQQTAAWTAEGDNTAAHFGASVSSAGDVNGDG